MSSACLDSDNWLSEFENGGLGYLTPAERLELDRLTQPVTEPPTAPDLISWAATHLRHRLGTYDASSPTLGLSMFQRDTARRLDALVTLRGQKDIDLAPRGYSKSTW